MPYLTTKEASEYLGVSIATLKRWRKENRSPPFFKNGATIRYPRNKLEEWAKAHTSA
jgi:excisionase family DNA binding protein